MTASTPSPGKRQAVAVYGANGHTGRFVVTELLKRCHPVVAMGRDLARLSAAMESKEVEVRAANLDDSSALERALEGVAVIINCAGPFLDTAESVVAAALRTRVHYLDVSAEQASATMLFERFSAAAKDAGTLVLPAMGFYGGFADLLATAATEGWSEVDALHTGIALDAWWPTAGTRNTGRLPRRPMPPGGPRNDSWWRYAPAGARKSAASWPVGVTSMRSRHRWWSRPPSASCPGSCPQAFGHRAKSSTQRTSCIHWHHTATSPVRPRRAIEHRGACFRQGPVRSADEGLPAPSAPPPYRCCHGAGC
nr:saccharopine dehydrogenase NADP-binding domain-containing protein [Comamonas sp. JC664]